MNRKRARQTRVRKRLMSDHDLNRLAARAQEVSDRICVIWPPTPERMIERLQQVIRAADDCSSLAWELYIKYTEPHRTKLLATGGRDWIQARLAQALPTVRQYKKRRR